MGSIGSCEVVDMNKRLELTIGTGAAIGLLIMIIDGKTAFQGAAEGLTLCLNTLIPTLLPFFFLSNILTGSLMGRKIPLLRPIGRLCRIPEGAEYLLLTGFLGGYPLGASTISQACEIGSLSQRDGRRMLVFCNNCGPAFLFGIGGVLFHDGKIPWLIFTIHVLSAISVALMLPGEPGRCACEKRSVPTAVQALWQSVRSVAGVCGWVVLFRTALTVLERWLLWYFPKELQVILSGILELSNGCISLADISNIKLRFLLCICFLSFGGLCVTMQTYSVADGLDTRLYFPGKVLQTIVGLFLGLLLCSPKWSVIPGSLILILVIFLRKREIRCRNPQKLVV